MKRLEDVLDELRTVERTEVLAWIEQEWVRPDANHDQPAFRPVDVARLRLIRELRHELAIDQDAMPVVLSLIDEMYTLRRRLVALARAVSETPEEIRTTVRSRCRILLEVTENDALDTEPQ